MGSRVPNKYMEFCPQNLSLFQKKQNALNSPKSKINLTSTFHLVESQTCAVGGWGPTFGTKSQKKRFFYTFPKGNTNKFTYSLLLMRPDWCDSGWQIWLLNNSRWSHKCNFGTPLHWKLKFGQDFLVDDWSRVWISEVRNLEVEV